MTAVVTGVALRNFRPCALAFLALASMVISSSAQQLDHRERFEVPTRVRLSSHLLWSRLTNQVLPSYPVDAQRKGVQGAVVLMLQVEKDGRVSSVAVVSGNSLLATPAIPAAKRLRFQPYYLNDEAVPTEGQIIYLYAILPAKSTTVILAPKWESQGLRPEPQ